MVEAGVETPVVFWLVWYQLRFIKLSTLEINSSQCDSSVLIPPVCCVNRIYYPSTRDSGLELVEAGLVLRYRSSGKEEWHFHDEAGRLPVEWTEAGDVGNSIQT